MAFQLIPDNRSELPREPEDILFRFLEYIEALELTPYAAQEEAMMELIIEDANVILNTPTGSGKSLVAAAMHFKSVCLGRRSYYTCPIKALVNEKFLSLCREFGAQHVGMITGDASVNTTAPIICCTAEILANLALRHGDQAPVQDVIMDEFHFYSDRERGVAWQVPLLTLPHCRFLLMSATLGDTPFFERELHARTGARTVTVKSSDRPVPLEFAYEKESLNDVVEQHAGSPTYIVHFSQRAATETAAAFLCINFLSKDQKAQIAEELIGVPFKSPFGKQMKKLMRHGVGLHHAGLLPKYRVLVEKLVQKGLLHVICGTDTLGVGINVPISTVIFTQLSKYDGVKQGLLTVRDFQQIAGRAGRRGYDDIGHVVSIPPPHVLENLKADRKAAANPGKKKKGAKKKAPEGFVNWNEATFQKLIESPPEPLRSSFTVSHGMLLNVLSREEDDGVQAMIDLIANCHESTKTKFRLRRRAFQLFRNLLDKEIVTMLPPWEDERHPRIRVNVFLQEDFSLNQTLSMFLIHALELLDPEHPDYALDLLSLVEAILEDPQRILRQQLRKIRGEAIQKMKAEGIDYDERMERLEDIEYPKPNREFTYQTFNEFADRHPWVGQENIRPKSIAREMIEGFYSFADYIRHYNLEPAEGLLLRHLTQVYKVMQQTVPDDAKNEAFVEMEIYFESMIRETDSSLLDEWAKLNDPDYDPEAAQSEREEALAEAAPPFDVTRDKKAFGIRVRNETVRLLRYFSTKHYADAVEHLDDNGSESGAPDGTEHATPDGNWNERALKALAAPYFETYDRISLGPDARNQAAFRIEETPSTWRVELSIYTQIDAGEEGMSAEEATEWVLEAAFDLDECRAAERAVPALVAIRPIG